ncbi:DUF2243 domain-containing protein [Azospirillum sp. 412522]|nr:DUF2243 domain-containing protein [Azospirillum sp. 412522]MBY6263566.1 DUF2243 domain-containing protein [Azospirillum sp. 412522]
MTAADPLPPPFRCRTSRGDRDGRRLFADSGLGFALGGFFDGLLLHQILQWHHLLSGLASPAYADITLQTLADGWFHALMYAIALLGLWLLWRGRAGLVHVGGRRLTGWALLVSNGAVPAGCLDWFRPAPEQEVPLRTAETRAAELQVGCG